MHDLIKKNMHETNVAYTKRIGLVCDIAQQETVLAVEQQTLQSERSKILLSYDPKDLGANETVRNARIAELTAAFQEQVTKTQAIIDLMKANLEMARLECRRCDLTLQHLTALQSCERETAEAA
jgi:hypothetical protein